MDDRSRWGRLVSGDRRFRFRLARLGNLVAQLKQDEQDFVALRLELSDGARTDLGMDAVDELLLHFSLTTIRQGVLQKLAAPGTFLRFPSTVISQSELGLRFILSAHRAFKFG